MKDGALQQEGEILLTKSGWKEIARYSWIREGALSVRLLRVPNAKRIQE